MILPLGFLLLGDRVFRARVAEAFEALGALFELDALTLAVALEPVLECALSAAVLRGGRLHRLFVDAEVVLRGRGALTAVRGRE